MNTSVLQPSSATCHPCFIQRVDPEQVKAKVDDAVVEVVGEADQVSISTADREKNKEPDIYKDPRIEARAEVGEKQLKLEEAQKQKSIDLEVKALSARDREVRAHEQAHMSAGGQYAGSATYEYQRGPNGVNYAVGGEVPISTGAAATPEESLRKAQIIRSAALAPAEPSSQDRKVAAMASQMEIKARSDLAEQRREASPVDEVETNDTKPESEPDKATSTEEADPNISNTTSKELSHNLISLRAYNPSPAAVQAPGTLFSDHA